MTITPTGDTVIYNDGSQYNRTAEVVVPAGASGVAMLVTCDGEMFTTNTERERNGFASYGLNDVGATTYAILIDKSDTTNFPHDTTDDLHVSTVYLTVDRDANAIGTLRMGVITRVDGTNADVTWFAGIGFVKSDERHLVRDRNFAPSQMRCVVESGNTPYIASNAKSLNVAAINTGTTLNTPVGTATPAVEDVVVAFEWTAGTYNASASCFYHSHP